VLGLSGLNIASPAVAGERLVVLYDSDYQDV